jgi:hypothetical protein
MSHDDDPDITRGYHGGNPQSTAAHASTRENRANVRLRVLGYFENQPRGAIPEQAGKALGITRSSISARCSELTWLFKWLVRVCDCHRHGWFTDIPAQQKCDSGHNADVLIPARWVQRDHGDDALAIILAEADDYHRKHHNNPPIETMNEGRWRVYNFVDQCGLGGATCDEAERHLGRDSGPSARCSELRKVKFLVPVGLLRRHGVFLGTPPLRHTTQRHAAAVLVSARVVFTADISNEVLEQIFTAEERARIQRLLLS